MNPSGIVFDSNGNFYISEKNYIKKVDLNGIITTVAGTGNTGNTGDSGPPIQATFGFIFYLTIDQYNNLFISDNQNYNIRKINFGEQ
jgi:hypothetical protein